MKNKNNAIVWIGILFSVLVVTSCNKSEIDTDQGFAYIYMPQAASTGGVDSTYAVPSGGGVSTYNFKVENGRLNITLGVLRSGKLSNASFSVECNCPK